MLVQFGSNRKVIENSSDSQIGLGLRPGPVFAVLGIFFIKLFPNRTTCSPVIYTNTIRDGGVLSLTIIEERTLHFTT